GLDLRSSTTGASRNRRIRVGGGSLQAGDPRSGESRARASAAARVRQPPRNLSILVPVPTPFLLLNRLFSEQSVSSCFAVVSGPANLWGRLQPAHTSALQPTMARDSSQCRGPLWRLDTKRTKGEHKKMLVGIAKLAAESQRLESKRQVEYFELPTRSLLNRTKPGLPFEWAINPYRGCEFGCRYCYARYTHEFMDLD